jgi:FlaA1/EpsC-like NDP-sugar epimerase
VIPVFQEQKNKGVITVTDKRMTRFWITLDQGVAFVQNCLDTMHGGEIFVPKIPSMNIMDLVEAIAPGCEVQITGVRTGEKLHEVLISENSEADQTIDLNDLFIIQPRHSWWAKEHWSEGKPVPEGFRYSSDTNEQTLSVSDLREIVAGL